VVAVASDDFGVPTGNRSPRPVVVESGWSDLRWASEWDLTLPIDDRIFSFNAPFFDSTGNIVLNKAIEGMASAPSDLELESHSSREDLSPNTREVLTTGSSRQ
jgi:hypothetical protein